MGGTLRAAPTGATAIFLNPAGMPLIRGYVVEGFYDFHIQKNGHIAHSSVVDSVSSKWVSAGLYYNFLIMRPKVTERTQQKELSLHLDGHETGLALAVPLGSRFSLGATVKYQYFKATVDTAGEDDEGNPLIVEREVDKINNVGVDVGVLVRITKGFTLGVTGMNLVPQKSTYSPMSLGIGLAYGYKQYLLVAVDLSVDFTSKDKPVLDYHGGAEVFLGSGKYAIRAGAMHQGLFKATYLTAGFGFNSKRAGIDVFVAQTVDGGIETQLGFAVKMLVK